MGIIRVSGWRRWVGCAFALVAAGLSVEAARGERGGAPIQVRTDACDLTTTGRIVAIGDVHGAFDRYISILREAKLIDERHAWIGGNATLVQVGDVIDRGDESRKVLDFIRQLEGDARKGGGQVRLLLGNHEIMRMTGDWRYVTEADVDSYKTAKSEAVREQSYMDKLKASEAAARSHGDKLDVKAFRKDFIEKTPLGAVEMEKAFSPSGQYGGWLREHDIMARINGVIFVHGGPSRDFAERGCAALNAQSHEETKALSMSDPNLLKLMLWSADGPLWYRGLVGVEPVASADDVTAILKSLGASRIVVGHTASTPGRIRLMQEGRVIAIDSGMLGGKMFPNGVPSALEIDKGTFTAIYEGKRDVLITPGPAGKRAVGPAASRR